MNTAFDDACVDEWEHLLNAIDLPDEFLMNQLDLDPERVMTALRVQAAATRNPPPTVADVLGRLEKCGAPQFATSARRQLWRTRQQPASGASYDHGAPNRRRRATGSG